MEEPPEDALIAIERRSDPRTEVVRRAPTTENEATIGGALAVDDQVAVIAKVSRSASPISDHSASESGSVAMIIEYTGTTVFECPASSGV